jgi:hypothetical protein
MGIGENGTVHYLKEVQRRPDGKSAEAALRRLRRHRPDLLARVVAKELSAHAAMIQAGFRTRTITIPLDPKVMARRLKGHLDAKCVESLIAELSRD